MPIIQRTSRTPTQTIHSPPRVPGVRGLEHLHRTAAKARRRTLSRWAAALAHLSVLAIAASVFFVQGPLFLFHPCDRLADGAHAVLNAWILRWHAHVLANPLLNVWDAPIYSPVKNTFAFSETMFGNLWITLPIQYLTGNHLLAANVLVFVSFILGMYFTFLLVRRLTDCFPAGVVAGMVFSFNPYRWSEIPHVQLLPF